MSSRWFLPARGQINARLFGAARTLRERADSARSASKIADATGHTENAIALRGKSVAYREAADVIEALERGTRIPRKKVKDDD